jgi:Tfp pilus assembly protein PilF
MRKIFFVVSLLGAIASLPVQAQAQNSRVGASYFKRANQRFARGDVEGAIADFGVAIMADPQFAMAYNNRGISGERSGDTAEAIADYTKAIEINPRLSEAFANRCKARLAQRTLDSAIIDCNDSIKQIHVSHRPLTLADPSVSKKVTSMARLPITAVLSPSIRS